jgi:thioredoxin 1
LYGRKFVSIVITLTSGNFNQEVLQSTVPVLIDFWAPWCGPCRTIGPILDQLANEYEGKIKVGKVNIDEDDEENGLAGQHGISSIPTLILYKDGEVINQKKNPASKHEIEAVFRNFI